MSTRVRQIKRSLSGDLRNLDEVRKQLGLVNSKSMQSALQTVLKVQKSLNNQQLRLNYILDVLAFNRARRTELEKTVRTLRAKLKRGR